MTSGGGAAYMEWPRATGLAWERLSERELAEVSSVDGERLALERSRLPDSTARLMKEPVYSLRSRFGLWERLAVRMENDWEPGGRYIVDEYVNDLESRDDIDTVLKERRVLAESLLADLLAHLDQRFLERTVPDGGEALRPYARRLREGAPLNERWYRRPVKLPWL